jgi:hypothetical protein
MLLFMPALIAYFTPSRKYSKVKPRIVGALSIPPEPREFRVPVHQTNDERGSRMFHLTSVPTCIDSETREINLCPVLTPEGFERGSKEQPRGRCVGMRRHTTTYRIYPSGHEM